MQLMSGCIVLAGAMQPVETISREGESPGGHEQPMLLPQLKQR
jgi:hypothetical protein